MTDRAYILMRTIEPQLTMAERNGMNEIWMTTGFVHEIIEVLKGEEAEWLEVDNEHKAFDCSQCGAMAGRKCLYCPGCGSKMKNGTRAMPFIESR